MLSERGKKELQGLIERARAYEAAEIAAMGSDLAFDKGVRELVFEFAQPRPSWMEDWSELGRRLARVLYFWR